RMKAGLIEETRIPRNPVDVLAQQIVAMCSIEDVTVDDVAAVAAGAYPFADCSRAVLESVLDMLAGRYPSDEFAELRPRIVWARANDILRARPGARLLPVTRGGTIPDRGLYGVYTPEGSRAGALDERAVRNLRAYLAEEREVTGALPTDRQIIVERFRDELGDWRVCVLTPFGGRVHAPWAIAIEAKVQSRLGLEVQTMWSDEGIVVRLPEADDIPPVESVLLEPEEVEDLVVSQLANTALFAG